MTTKIGQTSNSQEFIMGGVFPSRLGAWGSVVTRNFELGGAYDAMGELTTPTHFRAFEIKFGLFWQHYLSNYSLSDYLFTMYIKKFPKSQWGGLSPKFPL